MITDGIKTFNLSGTKMKLDKLVIKTMNIINRAKNQRIHIPKNVRRNHVKSILASEIAKSQRQKIASQKAKGDQPSEKTSEEETQVEIVHDQVIQDKT